MRKVILDTNGFLRLLLNDIPEQADRVEHLIEKAKEEKIIILVPQIIIFEINFILQKYYLFERENIIDKLKSLVAAVYFQIESRDIFRKALLVYEEKNISLVDSFLLAKTQLENAELFTFDKDLDKLGKAN